jgi:hypothetical protein
MQQTLGFPVDYLNAYTGLGCGGGEALYIHDKSTRLFHTEFVQLHARARHGMKRPKSETALTYLHIYARAKGR